MTNQEIFDFGLKTITQKHKAKVLDELKSWVK